MLFRCSHGGLSRDVLGRFDRRAHDATACAGPLVHHGSGARVVLPASSWGALGTIAGVAKVTPATLSSPSAAAIAAAELLMTTPALMSPSAGAATAATALVTVPQLPRPIASATTAAALNAADALSPAEQAGAAGWLLSAGMFGGWLGSLSAVPGGALVGTAAGLWAGARLWHRWCR
jgi:hypothetical protein